MHSVTSSDVESQNEALPRETTFVSLAPEDVAWWRKEVGTEPFNPRPGPYHMHGLLSASRTILEREACLLLQDLPDNVLLVDVGGSPRRTDQYLQNRGRYLVPNLQRGDETRARQCPAGARAQMCDCRLQDCQHIEGEELGLMFVHSAYYFQPLELWNIIDAPNVYDCYVVGHVFPDAYGGFRKECTWEFDCETVRMQVRGNSEPYEHPPLPWTVGWVGPNGESFIAETIRTIGNFTYLWRVSSGHMPAVPHLTWSDIIADRDLSGPVQLSAAAKSMVADDARTSVVKFDVEHIVKVGPVLVSNALITGQMVRLTMPVVAVAAVAKYCVGRQRDAQLLSEASFHLKRLLGGMRIPPSKQPQVLIAAVALGMVVNLENEVAMLNSMHAKFGWAYSVHSSLINFNRPKVLDVAKLVCFMLLFPLVGVLSTFVEPKDWERWLSALAGFAVFFLSLGCYCCCFRMAQRWRGHEVERWRAGFQSDGPAASLLPQYTAVPREHRPLTGTRFVRAPATNIVGKLFIGPEPPRERIELPREYLAGIIEPMAVPNVLEPTQNAELSAVTNRILSARLTPRFQAVFQLASSLKDSLSHCTTKVDTSYTAFDHWLYGLKQYSVEYRENLRRLWREYQGVPATSGPTRGFLKLEKSSVTVQTDSQSGGGELKATKPRLIQPPSDEVKAILGYVTSQMYKGVCRAWDGIRSPILYCSGVTTDAIGLIVDRKIDELGGEGNVEAWSVDFSTFDASLSIFVQDAGFSQYLTMGLPEWAVSWYTSTRTRGRTPNGVSYEAEREFGPYDTNGNAEDCWARKYCEYYGLAFYVKQDEFHFWWFVCEDFQMTSGRPDTNLMDTMCNAASFFAILRGRNDYLLLVNGDDAWLLMRKGEICKIQEEVLAFQRDCGLICGGEVSSRREDWEFCSKLFWFGMHPKTGVEQTVLAAKPGRGITRMGVVTSVPGANNIAQAALGVRHDCGHVPFLRVYAQRTYEVCRDRRIKPKGHEFNELKASMRFECSPKNFVITASRYALGQDDEAALEVLLSRVSEVPVMVHWEPVLDMARRDEQ